MNMDSTILFKIITIFLCIILAVDSCPKSDLAALLKIRGALVETRHGIFDSWKGQDCCNKWKGISCDPITRQVADINLRGEAEDPVFEKSHRTGYMTGYIHSSICNLPRLSSLTIADWKGISGTIPPCVTTLPFLRIIDLIGNRFSGGIPKDIGRLSRLTVLNMADNYLTGEIPLSITNITSLMHLDLRNNQLSGTLPINMGKLRMLSRALLSRNKLTGTIPSSISTIYRLADLDLSFNSLYGQVPASLGKMAVLSMLNLDGNRFTGSVPATLLSSSVTILNLSRNGLDGTIPNVFGQRSYFTAIDLSYNKLKGPIPSTITEAAYIGHLDLSHNHLCGNIPAGTPFDHLEASSFMYNDCLCGKPLKNC